MPDITFSELDIHNKNDIKEYERALFRAFQGTEILTLKEIWDFDNRHKRLKTKVPYQSQVIYIARLHGGIVAGTPFNFNMNEQLQLEMVGFSIDKNQKDICEGLGVFCLQVFHDATSIGLMLKDYAMEHLKERNIRTAYGTCSQRKLKGYQQLKFEVIDERMFMGEKKYLLKREVF